VTHVSRDPSNQSMSNQRSALLSLAEVLPVFPSPRGCEKHGKKVAFNEVLQHISNLMGTSRPKAHRLEDLENPPNDFVLKREFSDGGRDVYIPKLSLSPAEGIKRAVAFVKKSRRNSPSDACSWLAQEYVPFLSVSEIRFGCVGGSVIRGVVTGKHPADHPDAGHLWSYEGNECLKTLSSLQQVSPLYTLLIVSHEIHPGSW
jgi:hypothetical protein